MNLDELAKLEAAMTPGPWKHWNSRFKGEVIDSGHGVLAEDLVCFDDAAGIVALRNAAPALIAAAKERDELAALLRECADNCYMPDERRKRIAAALARLEGTK